MFLMKPFPMLIEKNQNIRLKHILGRKHNIEWTCQDLPKFFKSNELIKMGAQRQNNFLMIKSRRW